MMVINLKDFKDSLKKKEDEVWNSSTQWRGLWRIILLIAKNFTKNIWRHRNEIITFIVLSCVQVTSQNVGDSDKLGYHHDVLGPLFWECPPKLGTLPLHKIIKYNSQSNRKKRSYKWWPQQWLGLAVAN